MEPAMTVDEKGLAAGIEAAKASMADRDNHWEVALAVITAYESAKSADNRWPDPLESPQAEAIRAGKIDDTSIRDLFDKMERELKLHREAAKTAEGAVAWRDMGTAPRDGTRFLATGGGLGADIDIVSYSERVGCWNATNFTLDDTDHEPEGYSRPSRWQPLPPPQVPHE